MKEAGFLVEDEAEEGVIRQVVYDILKAYSHDPDVKSLPPREQNYTQTD